MFDRRLLQRAFSVRLAFILTVSLGFCRGLLIVLQARLISSVISQVFLNHKTLHDVILLLLVAATVIILRAVLTLGGELAANTVATQVKKELREKLYKHVVALGPAYLTGERTGELTHTAVEGVEALDAYFREYLPQVVVAALVPLTIVILVFPIDWISAVILLVTAPLIPLFMLLIGNVSEGLTRQRWQTLSRMSAHFLDVLQGLTTLKVFGRSREQIKVIEQIGERYRLVTMQVLRVAFISALSLELLSTLSTALVAVGIGVRLLYGRLAFADALFVIFLAPDFYLPLRMLGTRFHAGVAGVSASERIFSIFESYKGEGVPVKVPLRGVIIDVRNCSIRFENIGFSYPQESQPVLDGISFEIQPGEKVAIVGPSGAGKSTLANLLLRFSEPTQGDIVIKEKIDGSTRIKSLAEIPPDEWRAQVSWVPQKPYLFNASVVENIRMGCPAAAIEEVIAAARQAQAHDFIQTLPQGYETLIGERGARLSSGQAQRLVLARAFLKNAPLLILDEATANLDVELEAQLQETASNLIRDRSVLMIAHRLGSVYQADKILVFSHGKILQAGTHAELVQQAGLYRNLVSAYAGDGGLQSNE